MHTETRHWQRQARSAVGSAARRTPLCKVGAFDRNEFIEDVKLAQRESASQQAVEEVLGRVLSRPGDLMAGLGEPTKAGLHTLYADERLTILNVVWPPLMMLTPHNHNMWASIGVYTGREDNVVWRRANKSIEPAGAKALSAKQLFSLPADAIHSVANPIERLTGAIHIYGGNFFAPGRSEWDAGTLLERPYDIEAAKRSFAAAAERVNSQA